MNTIRTSFKNHKNIYLFFSIILLFGIISGILFYLKQDTSIKNTIILNMENIFSNNVFSFQNIFIHLGVFLIIIATSFLFLGIPLFTLGIFLEGISIGFLIPIFITIFKLKFIYTFGIYIILVKVIYLMILAILFVYLFLFTKEYMMYLKKKKTDFIGIIKKLFYLGFFLLFNDLCIYFLFNKVLIFLLG